MPTSDPKAHALQKIEKLNAIKIGILKRTKQAILNSSDKRSLAVTEQQIREAEEQKPDNKSMMELSEMISYFKQEIPRLMGFLIADLTKNIKQEHGSALEEILALSMVYLSKEETSEYLELLSTLSDPHDIENLVSALKKIGEIKNTDRSPRAVKENLMERANFLYQKILSAIETIQCYQSEEKQDADLHRLNQIDNEAELLTDPIRLKDIFKDFIRDQIEKHVEIFNKLHRLILRFSPEQELEILPPNTSSINIITLNYMNAFIEEARKRLNSIKILPEWVKEGSEILDAIDSPPPNLAKFETLKNSVGNTLEFIICLEQLRETLHQQKISKRYLTMEFLIKKLPFDEKIPAFEKFETLMKEAKVSKDFSAVAQYISILSTKIEDRAREALIEDLLSPVTPEPPIENVTTASVVLSAAPHATTFSPKSNQICWGDTESGMELKELNPTTRRFSPPGRPG